MLLTRCSPGCVVNVLAGSKQIPVKLPTYYYIRLLLQRMLVPLTLVMYYSNNRDVQLYIVVYNLFSVTFAEIY